MFNGFYFNNHELRMDCINVLVIKLLQNFAQPMMNLTVDMDGGIQWLCGS